MEGAQYVHTTPYHLQVYNLIERFYHTLKGTLICHSSTPWPDYLPLIMLGLRTCLKEDLQASPAEMFYGTTLRVSGVFFIMNIPR